MPSRSHSNSGQVYCYAIHSFIACLFPKSSQDQLSYIRNSLLGHMGAGARAEVQPVPHKLLLMGCSLSQKLRLPYRGLSSARP